MSDLTPSTESKPSSIQEGIPTAPPGYPAIGLSKKDLVEKRRRLRALKALMQLDIERVSEDIKTEYGISPKVVTLLNMYGIR